MMEMTINGQVKKIDGFKLMSNLIASQEKINIRQSICRECSELSKPAWICKQCGCFMKIKTRLDNSICPIKKW